MEGRVYLPFSQNVRVAGCLVRDRWHDSTVAPREPYSPGFIEFKLYLWMPSICSLESFCNDLMFLLVVVMLCAFASPDFLLFPQFFSEASPLIFCRHPSTKICLLSHSLTIFKNVYNYNKLQLLLLKVLLIFFLFFFVLNGHTPHKLTYTTLPLYTFRRIHTLLLLVIYLFFFNVSLLMSINKPG